MNVRRFLSAAVVTGCIAAGLGVAAPAALAAVPAPAEYPTGPLSVYFSTPYQTPLQGNACAVAHDAQGDAVHLTQVTKFAGGTLTVDAGTCAFTYAPDAGFSGSTAAGVFHWTDGAHTSQLQINLIVLVGKPGNAPPVLGTDEITVKKNRLTVIPQLFDTVLKLNDTDPNGTPLTGGATLGSENPDSRPGESATLDSGTFSYRPPNDFLGRRWYRYTASDGAQTVTQDFLVTVVDAPPSAAPVAVDDAYTVEKGHVLTVSAADGLFANDSDADSAYFTIGTHSSGFVPNDDTGAFTFDPGPDYVGVRDLEYSLIDSDNAPGNRAHVRITVRTMNPPKAQDDFYQVAQNGQLTVPAADGVLANDSDDDSTFAIDSVITPSHGTLTLDKPTGGFGYTPTAGWFGDDIFGYRLLDSDGKYGAWTTARVTTVKPGVNVAPIAKQDSYDVVRNTTLTLAAPGVLGNDKDWEGGAMTVQAQTNPAHGFLSTTAAGGLSYTPDTDYVGTDSYTYRVVDPQGLISNTVTVSLKVALGTLTTAAPSITGAPKVGSTLTAVTDPWGPGSVVLSYAWERDGVGINDANGDTYLPTVEDLGKQIRAKINGVKANYTVASRYSAPVTIAAGTLTAPVPTISGTPKVGVKLTAVTGIWGPGTVTKAYRWLRNGSAIAGATAPTYTPVAADKGTQLRVVVAGSRTGYATAVRTSGAKVIAAGTLVAPNPAISCTCKVGTRATAVIGTWGPGTVTKTIRWYRDGKLIGGVTGAAYRFTSADKGHRITVRVTGTKAGYATITRISATKLVS